MGVFKFQEDPRKLLALHAGDARKILIGPEAYKAHLDNTFILNGRKLYMFYEALQKQSVYYRPPRGNKLS